MLFCFDEGKVKSKYPAVFDKLRKISSKTRRLLLLLSNYTRIFVCINIKRDNKIAVITIIVIISCSSRRRRRKLGSLDLKRVCISDGEVPKGGLGRSWKNQ